MLPSKVPWRPYARKETLTKTQSHRTRWYYDVLGSHFLKKTEKESFFLNLTNKILLDSETDRGEKERGKEREREWIHPNHLHHKAQVKFATLPFSHRPVFWEEVINILREGTIEKSPLEQKKGDRDRMQERKLREAVVRDRMLYWGSLGWIPGRAESDRSAHPFPVSCWASHLTSLEPTFPVCKMCVWREAERSY